MRNLPFILLSLLLVVGCEKEESAPTETTVVPSEAPVATSESPDTACERAIEQLEDAVEKEDFAAALAIVNAHKKSTNAALRLRCVESIGWFGGKSAKALESFLMDPDEDVRSEAQDQWDSAVNDIEDEHERGVLVESAMEFVRDRDVMDTVATQLNDLPPSLSIDIIVHIIKGSNSVARAAAKEAYEFVTGDNWKGVKAAQKWLEENQAEPDEEDE